MDETRHDPTRWLVRSAALADVDEIRRLEDLAPATARLLTTDLAERAPRHAVVAEVVTADRPHLVGFAMCTDQADAAHVLDLVVGRAWRRRGIATAMLAGLAAAATAAGVPALTLEVRAGNAGARAFYAGLGFTDVGVRPGYYADGEDAHVLWHEAPTALVSR